MLIAKRAKHALQAADLFFEQMLEKQIAWRACYALLAISEFKVLAKMQSGAMSLSSSRADHVHAESHYVNTNKVLNGAIRWRRPHVNRMRGSEDISSSKVLWSCLVGSCLVGSCRVLSCLVRPLICEKNPVSSEDSFALRAHS